MTKGYKEVLKKGGTASVYVYSCSRGRKLHNRQELVFRELPNLLQIKKRPPVCKTGKAQAKLEYLYYIKELEGNQVENITTRLLGDMRELGQIDEFFITKNDVIFGNEIRIKGRLKSGKEYDLHLTVTETKKEDEKC